MLLEVHKDVHERVAYRAGIGEDPSPPCEAPVHRPGDSDGEPADAAGERPEGTLRAGGAEHHCTATAARDGRSSVLHPPPSASTRRTLADIRRPRMSTAVRSSPSAVA